MNRFPFPAPAGHRTPAPSLPTTTGERHPHPAPARRLLAVVAAAGLLAALGLPATGRTAPEPAGRAGASDATPLAQGPVGGIGRRP